MQSVLYISYDGMLEPLGQSQVLAYLEKLAVPYRIYLISFEKRGDLSDERKFATVRDRVNAAGIHWISLTYHKYPSTLATSWDIFVGGTIAMALVARHRIRVVHVRSYVPALMALPTCQFFRAKLLFDIRGFWVDERVDGGLWPQNGWLYRTAKIVEKYLFRSADHIVTLTHASVPEIETFPFLAGRVPPISVIPTCADLNRFRIDGRKSDNNFVFGYLGTVGQWYLFDEALRCFKAVRQIVPNARMLIVNRSEHALIRRSITRAGIDLSLIDIQAAEHSEVAPLVRRMSVGIALYKAVYSKLASAPTRLAEYLGCGVPCLGNVGVGDTAEILEGERVGIVLRDFSEQALMNGAERLVKLAQDPETANRCREAAKRFFSLETGSVQYREIYEQLYLAT
jgi:glycosyltransferase involved in cell wall biosynthesis